MPSSNPTQPPAAGTGQERDVDGLRSAVAQSLAGPPLHPRLAELLLRVQAAERTAVGEQRRPTFRLMRELLGASVRLGVPTTLLADCLGTTRHSVRNRAHDGDGTVTVNLIHELTGLTATELDRLSNGELTRHASQGDDDTYSTSNFIRAVLSTPPR